MMDFLPESVTRLSDELSKLPGIGPKSAQRLAFYLLKSADLKINALGESILNIKEGVQECSQCFSLTTSNPCKICSHPGRQKELLCVVESTLDLIAIEKTGEYRGLYHVLQGRISPLDGIGPEQIKLKELFQRVSFVNGDEAPIREVILALNPDLEGDTTALYIQKQISAYGPMQVSRIARGIPSGGHLEYTDEATLIRAMEGRQSLS